MIDRPDGWAAARNREIVADLQALWWAGEGGSFKRRQLAGGQLVFALAANAHAKSRAAGVLWDHGMWTESTPIVRSCFESALYAAWIQQVGRPAVPEVLANVARMSDNLLAESFWVGVDVPSDVADAVRAHRRFHEAALGSRVHLPAVQSRNGEVAKVEKLCSRLGGSRLYMIYRHLSGGSHALGSMKLHLAQGAGGELEYLLEPALGDREAAALSNALASSLIWATRAWSEMNVGKLAKKALQTAGRRLGVPPILRYMPSSKPAKRSKPSRTARRPGNSIAP